MSYLRRAVAVLRHEGPRRLAGRLWRVFDTDRRGPGIVRYLPEVVVLLYWRLRFGVPLAAGERATIRYGPERDERPVITDLLRRLRPDDVFYDVGAHTGLYTAIVASVGVETVAFEPFGPNADELERRLAERGLRARVVRAAIDEHVGNEGYDPDQNATLADGPTEVETVNADEQVATGEFPQPTVVKIDVAGGEHGVLRGMRRTLADPDCRLVYCEVHPPARHRSGIDDQGGSIVGVHHLLLDAGFETDILPTHRGSEYFLRGVKT